MDISNSSYYLYIIRCADNSLYCGITKDIEKRLKEHNGRGGRGAKYVRGRLPVTVVYTEEHPTLSSALKREAAVKRLSKGQKEELLLLQ